MRTFLDTRLLPLDASGAYLVIHGICDIHAGEVYRDDTSRATAYSGHLDKDTRVDLLAAMTERRPASPAEARSHSGVANGQRELVASGKQGGAYGRYLLECAARGDYSARIAATDQLWLPGRVATASNGSAVLCIITGSHASSGRLWDSVILRHIDCYSGDVLQEMRLRGIKGGVATPALHEYRDFLAFDYETSAILVQKFDRQSIDASDPRMILEERSLTDRLSTVCSTGVVRASRSGLTGCGGNVWISCGIDHDSRRASVSVIERATGRVLDQFELSRQPVSIAVSADAAFMTCGFLGGTVWVVDLETKETRKFVPHIGAGRDDWVTVQLAHSGDFFLSESANGFVLTSLKDGTSAPLGSLRDVVHEAEPFEGEESSIRIKSTISILGNRLASVEFGCVRELSADTGDHEDRFVSEAGRSGARKPVRVSRKAPIEESISKARLSAHEDQLLALRSPAVILRSKKLGKRGWSGPDLRHAPKLGASRFGGWPDLPEGSEWPRSDDRPMAFLAQVNLAEAHAAQPDLRLPKEGLLSYFLGCTGEVYTPENDERECYMADILQDRPAAAEPGWAVIYSPASGRLARFVNDDSPLPQLFNPALMRFQAGGKALPDEHSAAMAMLDLSPAARADYFEMIGQLQSSNAGHQLLGYPTLIQYTPPELYCEANGFDFPAAPETDEFREFERRASEWVMLLQLFSDQNVDYLWGDAGNLYFYIRRSALEQFDFSDTRVYYEN